MANFYTPQFPRLTAMLKQARRSFFVRLVYLIAIIAMIIGALIMAEPVISAASRWFFTVLGCLFVSGFALLYLAPALEKWRDAKALLHIASNYVEHAWKDKIGDKSNDFLLQTALQKYHEELVFHSTCPNDIPPSVMKLGSCHEQVLTALNNYVERLDNASIYVKNEYGVFSSSRPIGILWRQGIPSQADLSPLFKELKAAAIDVVAEMSTRKPRMVVVSDANKEQ